MFYERVSTAAIAHNTHTVVSMLLTAVHSSTSMQAAAGSRSSPKSSYGRLREPITSASTALIACGTRSVFYELEGDWRRG